MLGFASLLSLGIVLLSVEDSSAQTPPNSEPASRKHLDVTFNNTVIHSGVLIPRTGSSPALSDLLSQQPDHILTVPNSDALTTPVVASDNMTDDTYMIFMIDLKIRDSDITTPDDYDSLVSGLGVNRTTRLHWWGGNYTSSASGILVNSSDALSPYTSPMPPEGDIAHLYTFYLYQQPTNYSPSAAALEGDYYGDDAETRFNFSLIAATEGAGKLVAANYFLTQWNTSAVG